MPVFGEPGGQDWARGPTARTWVPITRLTVLFLVGHQGAAAHPSPSLLGSRAGLATPRLPAPRISHLLCVQRGDARDWGVGSCVLLPLDGLKVHSLVTLSQAQCCANPTSASRIFHPPKREPPSPSAVTPDPCSVWVFAVHGSDPVWPLCVALSLRVVTGTRVSLLFRAA
jgi:hypothetical protein